MAALPFDYLERVYAGVLGKIIGVYLGRPIEGWSNADIEAKFGEIDKYVEERNGMPLVVADDDISGTFTFLRALPDYGNRPDLTAAQIGQTWLNYIVEGRTILWWGGMGVSTEHTAFLRLKHGVEAPQSGSIALNGQVVAEQIGAQIFIDGWGLVNPGDPARAAHFARLAGSVSHDGTAVECAQVIAAMVALAFVESDVDRLLDGALAQISSSSFVRRLIDDVRGWHAQGLSWREGFARISERYGYDKFGGGCHTIPNHAIVIHALLHGAGDFTRSLMVANTCGWDTDCNSANVGCIVGVLRGLAGIESRWRKPVADRLYLPTADGGRCITDAVQEAIAVANVGLALAGEEPVAPKDGARFHFSLPGSVQGFSSSAPVSNEGGRLRIEVPAGTTRVATATFLSKADTKLPGYRLLASPTLYPGQTVTAFVIGSGVSARIYLGAFGEGDEMVAHLGDLVELPALLRFTVPDLGGQPTAEIGLEMVADAPESVDLSFLTWDGAPSVTFGRPKSGQMWRSAWVDGMSEVVPWGSPFRLAQNEGTGLSICGTREWTDYRASATIVPHLAEEAGLAVRVQGLRRYYGLLACRDGYVRLVRELDGRTVLAEVALPWSFGDALVFELSADGGRIFGLVNGLRLEAVDDALVSGAVAFVVCEGRIDSEGMTVGPV